MSDDMASTIERETAPAPARAGRPTPVAKPGGSKRTVFLIMGVVLLGLVAVGVRRWIYSLSHVSTDNAQVDGHIVPILPKVGGYVLEVRTDENRSVRRGTRSWCWTTATTRRGWRRPRPTWPWRSRA